MDDADATLRWHAARALGSIGPDAKAAIPALTARLKDEDPIVRAQSAFALGLMGDDAKPVAAELVGAVGDEEALVRRAALRALFRIKPDREVTRPLFLKLLQSSDPLTVTSVLHSMAELGADAVPAVADALEHPESRYFATLVVQEIGEPAKALVPKLTELVKAADEPELRMHAILALGAIGEPAQSAVPAITEQLKNDTSNAAKYAAAYVLPKLDAKDAKADLQAVVTENEGEDGDKFLHLVATISLTKMFPDDEQLQSQSVKAIVAGLQSEDKNIRRAAVQGLAESKASSDEVAPALVAAIAAADEATINDVVRALSAMGADAVPRVTRGLVNEKLRGYAAYILGNIGPDAQDEVPELVEAVDVEDDEQFRREVLFTLGRIGPAAAPAVDKIIGILESTEDERIIASACYALRHIGPEGAKAGPALVGIYNDGDNFQKMMAIWALLKVRPGYESVEKRAIPLLTDALSHQRSDIRAEAAQALGEIGPNANPALPALKKATEDENEVVRSAAKTAIELIEK